MRFEGGGLAKPEPKPVEKPKMKVNTNYLSFLISIFLINFLSARIISLSFSRILPLLSGGTSRTNIFCCAIILPPLVILFFLKKNFFKMDTNFAKKDCTDAVQMWHS
jgi:hypothetical protein